MIKKFNKRIKIWFRRNNKIVGFTFLLLFPLAVGFIYALPLPQIIDVASGDLLAYYGTAFGILGSFIAYRLEIKKQKKERTRELRPVFFVEVTSSDVSKGLYDINISNRSEQALSYLYFYDEFVETRIQENYSFQVTYNNKNEKSETTVRKFNITVDPDIIDSDGYPKYVQIQCDDKDGNSWNCCYYKVKDSEKIYYYPRDFEIV